MVLSRLALKSALLLLCLFGLLGCPGLPPLPAGAVGPWQALAPGLGYARAQPWPDSVVHVLRLDLREPSLRLAITPWSERGNSLDQMPSAATALVALNASFFDRQFDARGWTVSGGEVWPRPMVPSASPLLACDHWQRCEVVFDVPSAPSPQWHSVVSGTPWLVRQGAARSVLDDDRCPALCAREHPRTALGLDRSRRFLWLVLVEGRRPPVAGVRLAPLAQWLQGLGVHDAVNLDGSGSSALFVQGQAVMARPANEPAQRRVANGVLVLSQRTLPAP